MLTEYVLRSYKKYFILKKMDFFLSIKNKTCNLKAIPN